MFRRKASVAVLVVGCSIFASAVQAQPSSQYTTSLLRNLNTRTSASGFSAQRQRNSIYAKAVPQFPYAHVRQNTLNPWTSGVKSKPFANAGRGPTVSPWLSLSNPYSSSASNYYTQVRPALEQQRLNQQIEQRDAMVQKQLNDLTVPPPYEPAGDTDRAPTGHTTVFMNNYGYYPQPQQQPRR